MATELEEQLESSQRDAGLILEDIHCSEFKSAVNGLDTVIKDLQKLRWELDTAIKKKPLVDRLQEMIERRKHQT